MATKRAISIRLSSVTDSQLADIVATTGMSQSEAIGQAIAHFHRFCGIPEPLPTKYHTDADMVRLVLGRIDGCLIHRDGDSWWEAERGIAGWAITHHTAGTFDTVTYGNRFHSFMVDLRKIEPNLDNWEKI